MNLTDHIEGDVAIIELSGRLTVNAEPGQLKARVADVLQRGAKHVLLDLSAVPYIDSTRLGELIAAHVTVSRQGGRLKLLKTPQRLLDLLTLAGLSDVFEHFDTTEDGMKSFENRPT